MATDTVLTVYKAREKQNNEKGKYHKPDKEKMEETWRKWKLRKAKGAFDLKKFLGNKKDNNGNQQTESKTEK